MENDWITKKTVALMKRSVVFVLGKMREKTIQLFFTKSYCTITKLRNDYISLFTLISYQRKPS
jgi:hypothetical protein